MTTLQETYPLPRIDKSQLIKVSSALNLINRYWLMLSSPPLLSGHNSERARYCHPVFCLCYISATDRASTTLFALEKVAVVRGRHSFFLSLPELYTDVRRGLVGSLPKARQGKPCFLVLTTHDEWSLCYFGLSKQIHLDLARQSVLITADGKGVCKAVAHSCTRR